LMDDDDEGGKEGREDGQTDRTHCMITRATYLPTYLPTVDTP
jgi:hypothetical protein